MVIQWRALLVALLASWLTPCGSAWSAEASHPLGRGRAVVHIGPPKTGSTALQQYMLNQSRHLFGYGWQWPRSMATNTTSMPSSAKFMKALVHALHNQSCYAEWGDRPDLAEGEQRSYRCAGTRSERAAIQGLPPEAVLDKFSDVFAEIAADPVAPNLVLSSEGLGICYGCLIYNLSNTDRWSLEWDTTQTLRAMLAPFPEVTIVAVYRTPRIAAFHSYYTQEEFAANALRSYERGEKYPRLFSEWMFQVGFEQYHAHAGGIRRVLNHYVRSGFDVRVIASEGAARDGVEVWDVIICEVMQLPCTEQGTWLPVPAEPAKSNVRHTDLDLPWQLNTAARIFASRCTPGDKVLNLSTIPLSTSEYHLLLPGAPQRCGNLGRLNRALELLDRDFVEAYRTRMLHWYDDLVSGPDTVHNSSDVPEPPLEADFPNVFEYCELDVAAMLSSQAQMQVLQGLVELRGYNCGPSCSA